MRGVTEAAFPNLDYDRVSPWVRVLGLGICIVLNICFSLVTRNVARFVNANRAEAAVV